MPVTLPMARPADLAGAYLQGVSTAAQIQQAQQRLAAQQAETNARLQEQAKQAQEEHAVQQQRIAVAASYNQQKAALRKQQLDQVAMVNAEKTANAARQFQARQQWEQGFAKIDADTTLTPEQKDAARTRVTMNLAPLMGIPGTEAAAMLREMRPPKPTVPASVTDQGDFWQVTQPSGTVSLHPKPRASASERDPNVKVVLQDGMPPTTMPRSQALQVIKELPPEVRSLPVNLGLLKGAVSDMQAGRLTAPVAKEDMPVTKLDTPADVAAAYKAGKLTRAQAEKMLKEDFGIKE